MLRSRLPLCHFAAVVMLVLTTQVAYAAELCRSVMVNGVATGGTQRASGAVGNSGGVEIAISPCYDALVVQAGTCPASATDAAATTPAPSVFSQASVGVVVTPVAAPFLRLQSRADLGQPPPLYLLFHRLLN
jgi:hypothetical protein